MDKPIPSPFVFGEDNEGLNQMPPELKKQLDELLSFLGLTNDKIQKIDVKIASIKPKPPEEDLVQGITKVLNLHYENVISNVLGVEYNFNRNVAIEISKILTVARQRDKGSLAKKLQELINKLLSS